LIWFCSVSGRLFGDANTYIMIVNH